MRLGIKLLNVGASVNSFKQVEAIRIARGESLDLVFQLVDMDQKELRYIPDDGATVQVIIARSPEILKASPTTRTTINYTVDRPAGAAFTGDKSIWKIALVEADTLNMVSTSFKVIVTEGSTKKIATFSQGIIVIE